MERGFSSFKNPDVIGMTKGQFHYRHIPNLSLLVTFMWGAHNLHIWLKREADAAKAAAAALKNHRLLPRRSSQVAVVLNPGSALLEGPAEDSRGALLVFSGPDFHFSESRGQQNARRLLSGRLGRESRERFCDYSQDPLIEGLMPFWNPLEIGDF